MLLSVATGSYALPAAGTTSDKSSFASFIDDLGSEAKNIVKITLASATAIVGICAVLGYAIGVPGYVIGGIGLLFFGGEEIRDRHIDMANSIMSIRL